MILIFSLSSLGLSAGFFIGMKMDKNFKLEKKFRSDYPRVFQKNSINYLN